MIFTALHAATSGMESQNIQFADTANNLANVQSIGFKKSRTDFQNTLYYALKPKGADNGSGTPTPAGIEIGTGTQVVATTKDFSTGFRKDTQRPTDIMIDGDGFFEVQLPDGTIGYTRAGNFMINGSGSITTLTGLPVLGGFQSVPIDSQIYISENGTVTVESPGGLQNFTIQLTRFANPNALISGPNGIYYFNPNTAAATGSPETGQPGENGFGYLRQGALEESNVDVTEEMVNLILAQRGFEANSKVIQAVDETMGRENQIKR